MTAPHNDHDFRQLTGAFDRPIAPSPNFADALKKRVHEEETTMQQLQTLPVRPVSNRTARGTVQPLPGRRLLDFAIAAAVIIGMLASTFWYANTRIGGDGPLPPEATHYAAQPLSSASTPASAQDNSADSESGAHFDPSADHEVTVLENGPAHPGWAAVMGDTLVVADTGQEDVSKSGLIAINLQTGEVLWTSSLIPINQFVATETAIFGAFRHTTDWDYRMTGISLETGELLWAGDPLMDSTGLDIVSPAAAFGALKPAIVDGVLAYTGRHATIVGHDMATGEVRWTHPLEPSDSEGGMGGGGSIAAADTTIYVVDHGNAIRAIDPATGEEIDRFPLSDRPASAFFVELLTQDDALVAISRSIGTPALASFVDRVSTETGEILWSHRLGAVGIFTEMMDDMIVIPHEVIETEVEHVNVDLTGPGFYVHILDLEMGEPISAYGPSDATFVSASASGPVVCINEATVILCVDTSSETRTLVTLPYAPGGESFAPLLFWNDTAIVLDVDDGVTLLQPKDTQPQQAGTPMLPGDPGHTSAWQEPFDISGGLYANQLGGEPGYGASGVIVGDILIAEDKRLVHEDPVSFSGTGIYAQDLTTGEILWSNTDEVHQRYTADDSGVYILPQPATDVQRLIALDPETGEERWRSDPLSTFSSFPDAQGVLHAGTPIAIDGFVYLPLLDGNVIAFDGVTGDIAWAYEGMGQNIMDGDATIAGDSDRIYAVAGDNVITVLDRETGALEREFVLEGVPPSDYWLWPHVQADRLIIQARAKGDDTPGGMLVALDVASGEELWRQETGVMMSNLVVTPDRVGIVHAAFEDPSFVERIFSDTQLDGALSFSLFDLATGAPIDVPEGVLTQVDDVWSAALASSGETICLLYTTVTCFDPNDIVVTVDGYETSHITTIGQELLFWNGRLVILSPLTPNHLGGTGTHPKGTPVATPVAATPIATPVVATPEATP